MNQHHDSIISAVISAPVAVGLGTMPFWIRLIDETYWTATKIVIPLVSILVLSIQLSVVWRKLGQRGGQRWKESALGAAILTWIAVMVMLLIALLVVHFAGLAAAPATH